MSASRTFLIAPSAARQMRDARRWWIENRRKATAFVEELRRGFQLIVQHPLLGARATSTKLGDVRRIHLSRIRYYIYYRVNDSIEVLAFWHSSRGSSPI